MRRRRSGEGAQRKAKERRKSEHRGGFPDRDAGAVVDGSYTQSAPMVYGRRNLGRRQAETVAIGCRKRSDSVKIDWNRGEFCCDRCRSSDNAAGIQW